MIRLEIDMRTIGALVATTVWLAVLGTVGWLLGLDDVIRASIAAGHLLDWVVGLLGFVWLMILLKVPWDLYFAALRTAYDYQQAKDAGRSVSAEREAYLKALRPRLIQLAVGAHLASGAVAWAVGWAAGGRVGYWLAAIYVLSATLRPLAAAYAFLKHRLSSMGEEARYPRQDVDELRDRLLRLEKQWADSSQTQAMWNEERRAETAELRAMTQRTAREMETAVASVTDNQDVVKGIRAFVRLVTSAEP